MNKVTIWFADPMGSKIHQTISFMFHDKYVKYPSADVDLPKFVTKLGYPCKFAKESVWSEARQKSRKVYGLEMDEDTATAFILRFG